MLLWQCTTASHGSVLSLQASVVVADGQASCEQAKHQEWLRAGLVLDIVLDGVRNEVLVLEVHLRTIHNAESWSHMR